MPLCSVALGLREQSTSWQEACGVGVGEGGRGGVGVGEGGRGGVGVDSIHLRAFRKQRRNCQGSNILSKNTPLQGPHSPDEALPPTDSAADWEPSLLGHQFLGAFEI